jgi:hypothetical protein
MPGDLLLEQVGHSNLKATDTRTSMMRFVSEWPGIQGLFSQEDGPTDPKFPDFRSKGHVT